MGKYTNAAERQNLRANFNENSVVRKLLAERVMLRRALAKILDSGPFTSEYITEIASKALEEK